MCESIFLTVHMYMFFLFLLFCVYISVSMYKDVYVSVWQWKGASIFSKYEFSFYKCVYIWCVSLCFCQSCDFVYHLIYFVSVCKWLYVFVSALLCMSMPISLRLVWPLSGLLSLYVRINFSMCQYHSGLLLAHLHLSLWVALSMCTSVYLLVCVPVYVFCVISNLCF